MKKEIIKIKKEIESLNKLYNLIKEIERGNNQYIGVCYNCNKFFYKEQGQKIEGELYCEDCVEDLFVWSNKYCEYIDIDDAVYCEDIEDYVYNSEAIRCDDCGKWYYNENDLRYIEGYGNICDSCWDSGNYGYCESCGRYFCLEDLYYSERDECDYCCDCKKDNEYLNEYDYKPNPLFKRRDFEDKSNFFIGMELEISGDDKIGREVQEMDAVENNYYLKGDGSVRGFELVSHPRTFESWKEYLKEEFDDVLKVCKEGGCSSFNENGIHLHTSLKEWGIEKEKWLYNFFKKNKRLFKIVSQRSKEKEHWCNFNFLDNESFENIEGDEEEQVCKIKDKVNKNDRYVALNRTSETIEFRIFNGSLNRDIILKNIEFVYSLFIFGETRKMKTKEYLNFIKRDDRFKELRKFLNIVYNNRKEKLNIDGEDMVLVA